MSNHQLGIRPIRFYDISFPETAKEEVLRMIAPGKPWQPAFNKTVWALQKMLKLDPIPEFKPFDQQELLKKQAPLHILDRNWVECVGIGTKKDRFINGIEQI